MDDHESTDEMVHALAAKLREGTGQDTTWWGDCLDVARSALSAALAVDPKRQGGEADLSVADLSVEAEIEVTDEMIEAFRLAFCALKGKRRIIEDVLSVSPLREQVQKLTEENERLRAAAKSLVRGIDHDHDDEWLYVRGDDFDSLASVIVRHDLASKGTS